MWVHRLLRASYCCFNEQPLPGPPWGELGSFSGALYQLQFLVFLHWAQSTLCLPVSLRYKELTEVPQCHIVALSPTTRLLQALFIQISCAVDSQSSSCKPRQQRGPSYCCLALRVRWETHVNTSALLTFKSIHWSQCARGGGKVTQRLVAVLAACPWEAEPLPSPAPVLAEHCVPLLLFLLPLILAIPCSTLMEQTGGGALLCVFFVVVIFLAFFSM